MAWRRVQPDPASLSPELDMEEVLRVRGRAGAAGRLGRGQLQLPVNNSRISNRVPQLSIVTYNTLRKILQLSFLAHHYKVDVSI